MAQQSHTDENGVQGGSCSPNECEVSIGINHVTVVPENNTGTSNERTFDVTFKIDEYGPGHTETERVTVVDDDKELAFASVEGLAVEKAASKSWYTHRETTSIEEIYQ